MKTIALGNRLARDLAVKNLAELTADGLQAVADAVNAAIQKLDAVAPHISKTTLGAFAIAAPATISIDVVNGSIDITGGTFEAEQYGRTVRIDGDTIDNQVTGLATLLHPYGGTTGTVSATVYSDAIGMPEPYQEIIGIPRILETGDEIYPCRNRRQSSYERRPVARPTAFWVEANARNRSPDNPAVIRFYPIPDRAYRLEAMVSLAPLRVSITDLLSPGLELPFRAEQIESYLLPVARGHLTTSDLWRVPSTKTQVLTEAEAAERKFSVLAPQTHSTPANEVGTPPGF